MSFAPDYPGYGSFRFHESLRLTVPGETRLTHWRYDALPWVDRREPFMTYHNGDNCRAGYFQAARRGQEFVIAEEKSAVATWHLLNILNIEHDMPA